MTNADLKVGTRIRVTRPMKGASPGWVEITEGMVTLPPDGADDPLGLYFVDKIRVQHPDYPDNGRDLPVVNCLGAFHIEQCEVIK